MSITMKPQSAIRLIDVPFEKDGGHTLYFTSAELQKQYYAGLTGYTVGESNYTYVRKDSLIRVGLNIELLRKYNYLYYVNYQTTITDMGETAIPKTYYAFITKLEYVNENTTNVYIATDVMQTYLFEILSDTTSQSYINKQHVPKSEDKIGYNILPEGLETGEYINSQVLDSTSIKSIEDGWNNVQWTWGSYDYSSTPNKQISLNNQYMAIVACTELYTDMYETNKMVNSRNYSGIYSGLQYYGFGNYQYLDKFLKYCANLGQSSAIYSIFLVPVQNANWRCHKTTIDDGDSGTSQSVDTETYTGVFASYSAAEAYANSKAYEETTIVIDQETGETATRKKVVTSIKDLNRDRYNIVWTITTTYGSSTTSIYWFELISNAPSKIDTLTTNVQTTTNGVYTTTKSFRNNNNSNTYTAHNRKLYTAPYYNLLLTDNNGNGKTYDPGLFNYTSDIRFNIYGSVTTGGSVVAYPEDYKNIGQNYGEGFSMAKFPTCSWNTDSYTNWLTQTAVSRANQEKYAQQNLAMGLINGAVGIGSSLASGNYLRAFMGTSNLVSGALNYQRTIDSLEEEKYQHSLVPNSLNGQSVAETMFGLGTYEIVLYAQTITGERAKQIDEYFDRFGYTVNKTDNLVQAITSRSKWNYVKTAECNISANIPDDDKAAIYNIFNSGVTFWKIPSQIYRYDLGSQNN